MVRVLGRAPVAGDLGRVTGEWRPDPEIAEPACRADVTASYKLDVWRLPPGRPGETGDTGRHPGGGLVTGVGTGGSRASPASAQPGAGAPP